MNQVHLFLRPLLILSIPLILSGCTFRSQAAPDPIPINIPVTSGASASAEKLLTVQRGDVAETMAFPGKVSLAIEEELFFGVSGRVKGLYVDSGDTVAEGDLIAELDTRILALDIGVAEKAVRLAEQQVAEAEAVLAGELENAGRTFEIAELQLHALERTVNPDPYLIAIQKLEVEQARSALDRMALGQTYDLERLTVEMDKDADELIKLESSLNDAQLTAPFGGVIRLFAALDSGKSVQSVEAYESVASIVDPESLQIEANLVSGDLELLYEGMPSEISLVNRPGAMLDGEVRKLPQPFGTGTGTLTEITFSDIGKASSLRPGMAVEVLVELGRSENTLWLPIEALYGFNSNYHVELKEGATVREAPITVGLRNDEQIEILDGLQEGDQVVSR